MFAVSHSTVPLAAVLACLLGACSGAEEPGREPGDQGTAGAAVVPDAGETPDSMPVDQLPTREEICIEGPPGGLPIKDGACEYHACGEVCDPCGVGKASDPGCLPDAGVFRCTWQHMCTQTID